MSLPHHNPPGGVQDLLETNRPGWNKIINSFMRTKRISPLITPHFYNATNVREIAPETASVTWNGFPRLVQVRAPNNRTRWKIADEDRAVQDEYLEWSIERDPQTKKIIKIIFCNEGPEYFQYLAQVQPDTLVKLYQDLHPKAAIKKEDLFKDGRYNPTNKWNSRTDTGTIMHLIQRNNTLGAEIDLVARASILRHAEEGTPIVDKDRLVKCGDFGNAGRNSDPTIGAAINSLARQGLLVTVNDPVGLYIHPEIDWSQVTPPEGHEEDKPSDFWKWTRGIAPTYVRGEIEVPAGKGYVVGDLLVDGKPLEFGGQIADLMKVFANARFFKGDDIQPNSRRCGDNPVDDSHANHKMAAHEHHIFLEEHLQSRI